MAGSRGRAGTFKVWEASRREAGVAIVTVLLVFTVLLTLGLGALALALAHREVSMNEVKNAKAFYAAEAGIAVALAELQLDPVWPGYPSGPLPEVATGLGDAQIVEIKLLSQGEVLQVEARGEAGGLTRQLAALLQKPALAYGLVVTTDEPVTIPANSNLRGTFIFHGNVTVDSSVQVGDPTAKDGWIIARGNVTNKGKIYGGVRAGGSVNNFQGVIDGVIQQGVEIYLPPVTAPDLNAYRDAADQVVGGDLTWGQHELRQFLAAGKRTLYVTGNLTLDTKGNHDAKGNKDISYSGRAVLVAGGDIEIKADVVNADQNSALALIAGGGIDVGNQEVHALLHAGGSLQSNGNPSIVGAAVAQNLDVSGNFNLTFDQDLVWRLLGGASPLIQGDNSFKIVRWWAKGS